MLLPAQKEKFLVLHNSNSSVLGEVLESDAGTGLSEAEEGLVAPAESQGMVRGFLISPHMCGEKFHGLERQGALEVGLWWAGRKETLVAVAGMELVAGMGLVLVTAKNQGLGWNLVFLL